MKTTTTESANARGSSERSSISTSASLLGLAGWLALAFIAAALGAVASRDAGQFYEELVRPAWAPPGDLFGPVWTVLYALMGIAAWLAWRRAGLFSAPLLLFLVQLGLNVLWSWLFFAWRLGAAASAEIVLLWLAILATVILFWRVRPLAGVLLVPYLLWVTYAVALCISVWRANPELLG